MFESSEEYKAMGYGLEEGDPREGLSTEFGKQLVMQVCEKCHLPQTDDPQEKASTGKGYVPNKIQGASSDPVKEIESLSYRPPANDTERLRRAFGDVSVSGQTHIEGHVVITKQHAESLIAIMTDIKHFGNEFHDGEPSPNLCDELIKDLEQ